MTDRSRSWPVATVFGALFCVVLVYLALQLRAGQDPAIGAVSEAPAPAARQVVVRRIVVTRVVEVEGRSAPAAPGPSAPPAAAPPAAPPPPAPAAEPVVSRAS